MYISLINHTSGSSAKINKSLQPPSGFSFFVFFLPTKGRIQIIVLFLFFWCVCGGCKLKKKIGVKGLLPQTLISFDPFCKLLWSFWKIFLLFPICLFLGVGVQLRPLQPHLHAPLIIFSALSGLLVCYNRIMNLQIE